jgi:cobalt-zinc-cadmium efflux system protein
MKPRADHNSETARRLADRRRLGWTLVLLAIVMAFEIAGGYYSNSLALLSDAGHMLTDALAIGLAIFAVTMACRPASPRVTYGYYRLEILAALANGILLGLIALWLFYQAYRRFLEPPEVAGGVVMFVAAVGLAANVGGLILLRGGAHRGLNVRGAAMHVLSDALSSAAVVVGGGVIALTGWYRIDPIMSAAIGLVIVIGAFRLVREAVDILLETTPAGIDLVAVSDEICGIDGVQQVHDLHIWSITSGMAALSGHVVLQETTLSRSDRILHAIRALLRERYAIEHTTIQIESERYRETGDVQGGQCWEPGRGAQRPS